MATSIGIVFDSGRIFVFGAKADAVRFYLEDFKNREIWCLDTWGLNKYTFEKMSIQDIVLEALLGRREWRPSCAEFSDTVWIANGPNYRIAAEEDWQKAIDRSVARFLELVRTGEDIPETTKAVFSKWLTNFCIVGITPDKKIVEHPVGFKDREEFLAGIIIPLLLPAGCDVG